ncbi:RidA family protein [Rhodoferax sp.]|uniref:RidA family protein n=1 Tax=Rhodoferax sp. TaxID=50421 RepID=UPI002630B8A2|nr:RidA family protein [Rhodoferax sp.]MDD2924651.1 RidA family protein [Rhodoferax sp.]
MRRSIDIEGFSHGTNPVPAASVIGRTLMTGAIFGTVRETGKVPESVEEQCRLMFENVARILEAAGGNFDHILKMTFYTRPGVSREMINTHWVARFPDPASRPARHVIVSETLPASMSLQCDLVAQLDGDSSGHAVA